MRARVVVSVRCHDTIVPHHESSTSSLAVANRATAPRVIPSHGRGCQKNLLLVLMGGCHSATLSHRCNRLLALVGRLQLARHVMMLVVVDVGADPRCQPHRAILL